MGSYRVRIGLRDADSAKYVGTSEQWERAEDALRESVKKLAVPFTEERGEAAFYGPKIDFVVKDVIGREWQLGTVQVDYNLPERFGLSYVATGQFGTSAGDDPSSAVRFSRTFLRRFDRAFCGKFSGLAGAGTGSCPSDLGKTSGIWQVRSQGCFWIDRSGRQSTKPPTKSALRFALPSWRRSHICWSSAHEKNKPAKSPCAAAKTAMREPLVRRSL